MAKAPAAPPLEPPAGLTDAQGDLWRELAAQYAKPPLAPGDLVLLRLIVDVAGRVDAVRAKLDAEELVVDGSQQQPVANPLISAEARLRGELRSLLQDWALVIRWRS